MAVELPKKEKRGALDVTDIRQAIMDRSVEDNSLELDLFFSDIDIGSAFRMAALAFNGMKPRITTIDPNAVGAGTASIMVNGVLWKLYVAKLAQLARNNVEYSAGNTVVDVDKRRIEHLREMWPVFRADFEKEASDYKTALNIASAYRAY